MYKIYKYQITPDNVESGSITLPYNAKILSVINQNENIMLYCLVNAEEDRTEERSLILLGTGWDIDDVKMDMINYHNFNFIGTVVQLDGKLVWHLWMK